MNTPLEDIPLHLPPGWSNIAKSLQERLKPFVDAGGTIHQVKEKFGELRVYTDFKVDLDDLVVLSANTCATCGEPGKLTHKVWIIPLCEKHDK